MIRTNSFPRDAAYALFDIKLTREWADWQYAAAINNLFDRNTSTTAWSIFSTSAARRLASTRKPDACSSSVQNTPSGKADPKHAGAAFGRPVCYLARHAYGPAMRSTFPIAACAGEYSCATTRRSLTSPCSRLKNHGAGLEIDALVYAEHGTSSISIRHRGNPRGGGDGRGLRVSRGRG